MRYEMAMPPVAKDSRPRRILTEVYDRSKFTVKGGWRRATTVGTVVGAAARLSSPKSSRAALMTILSLAILSGSARRTYRKTDFHALRVESGPIGRRLH